MIFKNFADQDRIGFNFIGSGLDSDWKIPQSAHLCYTDEWIDFKWRNLVWLEYFQQYKKLKNGTNKKVQNLQKLIKEVQKKKKAKQKKTKGVLICWKA